jgi:septum formation protein
VLASASPARRRLLLDAGITPVVLVSAVDEQAEVDRLAVDDPALPRDPDRVALALARSKALDVVAALPPALAGRADVVVVGCDSVLWEAGEVLGKPRDADDAVARWHRMRGGSGTLVTGHAVVRADGTAEAAGQARTEVRFASPDDEEVAAYVATGEPLRVAGAFTLDGLGAAFVEGIDGDPSNVVGLSLPLLRRLLREVGVRWTDLWHGPDGEAPAHGSS